MLWDHQSNWDNPPAWTLSHQIHMCTEDGSRTGYSFIMAWRTPLNSVPKCEFNVVKIIMQMQKLTQQNMPHQNIELYYDMKTCLDCLLWIISEIHVYIMCDMVGIGDSSQL